MQKDLIHERMRHVRDLATRRFHDTLKKIASKQPADLQMLGPDWRKVPEWKNQKGYPNPQWGPYREVWHVTREAGEAALVLLMIDPESLPESERNSLCELIRRFDYAHNSSCGILYHLTAYWKARRHGVFLETP